MFTGLVQAVGRVSSAEPTASGRRLVVDLGPWDHRPGLGDSISVSGCCLTVAAIEPAGAGGQRGGPGGGLGVAFDAVPETLAKTTLGGLVPGDRVNLEHAATPTTLLGGHLVQGHVDGVGRVVSVQTAGEWRVRMWAPAAVAEYLVPKGSVTVEGVSLTVAALGPGERAATEGTWFEVALIPVTLERTTLAGLSPGDAVNLEADVMGKTIVTYLRHYMASVEVGKAGPEGLKAWGGAGR